MKKIDSFINLYSLSKTLQFKLIPQGKTLENFTVKKLLEQDVERAKAYEIVKGYIDSYHRHFIDEALSAVTYLDVSTYANLYYKTGKSDKEKKALNDEAAKLRKTVNLYLIKHENFPILFKKELITQILPSFLTREEELEAVAQFNLFSTYFKGFHDNRRNIYSDEEISTSIAYRCINDNLPKFLDNFKSFTLALERLDETTLKTLADDFVGLIGMTLEELFSADNFFRVLTQSGIDRYNEVIGGYTTSDGIKVQGLNEYINLYNQVHEKSERIPTLKILFKQILSDREGISFIPESFENDDELLVAVNRYWNNASESFGKIKDLFLNLNTYDSSGIFISNGLALTEFSNSVFESWSVIRDLWNAKYDEEYIGKSKIGTEKYETEKSSAWKSIKSFSLEALNGYVSEVESDYTSAVEYYSQRVVAHIEEAFSLHALALPVLNCNYSEKAKRLSRNDGDIALIKNFLDAIKTLERTLRAFVYNADDNPDSVFYGELELYLASILEIDRLYDKVRNHITKKPYSNDKIKLNFENPQLLGGWDKNKESAYRTVLLRKNGLYYLAIMDKSNSAVFANYPTDNSNGWMKLEYKLLPGPFKMLPKVFFAKSNIEYFAPSQEVLDIYERKSFMKGDNFSIEDCRKIIEFYQKSISMHTDWSKFGFVFKSPEEYADISEFYKDVELQGYKAQFEPISEEYINNKIDSGEIYLFQIYSKDFSEYSKGTPNMHTLYFKMLFDERNLANVVYKLNGEAEMFYRFPSIKKDEMVIHPKGEPVKNKRANNEKAYSKFDYDLVKDKRFTEPQFSLHLPIALNFKARGNERINIDVRQALKDSDRNYVIGIDRGERHLVYVTVIDDTGRIVEQFSGNVIGEETKIDYHALLDKKEDERLKARQNWTAIENIKGLKEGYVSQIVHKICELVIKYDAVIAMEDLNQGFKNTRTKVEKQVYQKFEKMLIDKLNYLALKKVDPEENGGILRAYQLTEKFESFAKMKGQNGFIFYVPAWLTSKIDPTTGFVDLLKPKYTNENEAKSFIERFKSIAYNSNDKYFEFEFDYRDFPKGATDSRCEWTVCTYGERISNERSKEANGHFDSVSVDLTSEWIKLFEKVGIDYQSKDLKTLILNQKGKDFFKSFIHLLRLTLQMRNSITDSEVDYLVSPVKNKNGQFFDTRNVTEKDGLPMNADANGAYNIARKALWAISMLKACESEDELKKAKLSISNKEWLAFAQDNE